jgi:hypothetical protein
MKAGGLPQKKVVRQDMATSLRCVSARVWKYKIRCFWVP